MFQILCVKTWLKLGQRPILTSEMLFLLESNMFWAKRNTLEMVVTLGQGLILQAPLFLDIELNCYYKNLKPFLIFYDFLACKSVQILANELFDTVRGQLLAKGTCVDQESTKSISFNHILTLD